MDWGSQDPDDIELVPEPDEYYYQDQYGIKGNDEVQEWYNHPPEPDYPTSETLALEANAEREVASDLRQFLSQITEIDPSQIRGVAFPSLEEAVSWLQNTGLLPFSTVVQQGPVFYPVVGDSLKGVTYKKVEPDEFDDYDDDNDDNADDDIPFS